MDYDEEKMFTKGVVMNNRMVEMVKFLAKKDLTSFSHIARKAMLYGIEQMMDEKNLKDEFENFLQKKKIKIAKNSTFEDEIIEEIKQSTGINNKFENNNIKNIYQNVKNDKSV